MRGAQQQQLRLSEVIDIGAQIAAALAAAHEAGIVHRDIKPENVMLRRDGYVKVLDFGLAKLTETSAPPSDTQTPTVAASTESGMVLGTPRYMSPEQVCGEKVDARTDIFSLGVLLYEMIAGRAPFTGPTQSELMAAILRDEPPPLAGSAPDTPLELEQAISRMLSKDRAARYQTAQDLLADLRGLKQRIELEANLGGAAFAIQPAIKTPKAARKRLAIAAAAFAIAIIALWFYFKSQPALTEKDTVLVADFENRTGEEIFDQMLKQGLAIQLQQTPYLNLFSEAQVSHELKLMRRSPDERVTAEIAREICERQNLKALIAGSIAPLGNHYVITLEAINAQSGGTLAHEQVEANHKEQVLQALSRAATRLRERLGESLSSIQRFDRPLQEGTTDRLQAFKAYTQAIELAVNGRLMEAIPFYRRAVELDPDFAIAYCQLAIMYWATGQPDVAAEYVNKAYRLKERAGEIEKFRITHIYYRIATGDLNKAIEVLRLQRRTYPREYTGPLDLAAAYHLLGQSDQAILEARESINLNPNFAAPYMILAGSLLRLNRFAEVNDILSQALRQGLDHSNFHLLLYQLAFIEGDRAGIERQLDWAHGRSEEHMALDWQTGAAAFAGQWRKAQDFSRSAIALAAGGEMKEVAARYAAEQSLRGALFEDCRRAGTYAQQRLKLARGRVSLARAALALSLCGENDQVKSLIDEMAARFPQDTLINSLWLPAIRAALELQRGNASEAVAHLQTSLRYEAGAEFWPPYLRGQAYLKLDRGAEAAAEFQKILDHRGQAPLSVLYPLAHLGLARAAALAADPARSRNAYHEFFGLWREADPDLQILKAARREYERRKLQGG